MKSILTTNLRISLSACCLFFILPFLQAQPWSDCDTIRIFSIHVDGFEDSNHQDHFLQAVNHVSVLSEIPMKVLGYNTIVDTETYSYLINSQAYLNYLNPDQDETQPTLLKNAIEAAINDYDPDILLLKVGPVPAGVGMVASLADIQPRRGWYSDFGNNTNLTNEIVLVSAIIARLTGFIGFDDSEPNIFSTPGSLPPGTFPTNFTDSTLQVMRDNYQTITLGSNELRDCSDLTAIHQSNALALEFLTFPDRFALIGLEKKMAYQLVNPLGQLIGEGQLRIGDQEISFQEVPNGLYYLKISDGKEALSLPLWIRH